MSPAILQKFDLDIGNRIMLRTGAGAAGGVAGFMVTERKCVGSFEVEAEKVATSDFFGIMKAGTQGSISLTVGGTAGNIITISSPKAQYKAVKWGDAGGVATYTVDLRLPRNTGDDAISLIMT